MTQISSMEQATKKISVHTKTYTLCIVQVLRTRHSDPRCWRQGQPSPSLTTWGCFKIQLTLGLNMGLNCAGLLIHRFLKINIVNLSSLPYDFLHNSFFYLAYFIVRIQIIKHKHTKCALIDCLYY